MDVVVWESEKCNIEKCLGAYKKVDKHRQLERKLLFWLLLRVHDVSFPLNMVHLLYLDRNHHWIIYKKKNRKLSPGQTNFCFPVRFIHVFNYNSLLQSHCDGIHVRFVLIQLFQSNSFQMLSQYCHSSPSQSNEGTEHTRPWQSVHHQRFNNTQFTSIKNRERTLSSSIKVYCSHGDWGRWGAANTQSQLDFNKYA